MEAKRNKLVIIGNGFDLAHGFKTSYNDFILWYLNDCIRLTLERYNYEDKLLTLSVKYSGMKPFVIMSLKRYKNLIADKNITLTFNSQFLQDLIETSREYNWIDIEKEYYALIVRIYQNIISGDSRMYDSSIIRLNKLNDDFEFLRVKLQEYLTIIQKENIQNLDPNLDKGFGYLFQEEFYESFENSDKKILFLNFNYTSTIEAYIKKRPLLPHKLNYIHGKLKDSKNPIIFGFGDEIDGYYKKIEELNINEFLNNFKSFGYFKTDNYQNLLSFVDSESFDVEILGHSCGLSDRVLLNTIFEHDNCEAIKIHFYENDNGENDFTFKTQEISRHFNDGVKSKAKMRKRIVNFHDCQPLKV